MTEYGGKDITNIPKKWNKEVVVYNKTYRWMLYKPDKERTLVAEQCQDCKRLFYGSDGKLILTLHRIINHAKEVMVYG